MMARSRTKLDAENGTELLPGIPNDITLQVISTMLPWETVHVLSSVSHAWQQAVQRGEIYDARIQTRSTETLVVINQVAVDNNEIFLYSPRDKACIPLPPIPHVYNGFPYYCRCITLDGKIYILGGFTRRARPYLEQWRDVYVLDIARQSQWRRCAPMLQRRYRFGCGVMDGKIYVCSGLSRFDVAVCESEVYDPKIDTWSSIASMTSSRYDHQVGIVNDELLVYGGSFSRGRGDVPAPHFEVYNPVQDRWRQLPQGPGADLVDETKELLFMVEGKLHSTTGSTIFAYDLRTNTKTPLYSCSSSRSFAVKRISSWRRNPPKAILAVEGQLLAVVLNKTVSKGMCRRSTLCISTLDGAKCVWQEAGCSLEFGSRFESGNSSMVAIRL